MTGLLCGNVQVSAQGAANDEKTGVPGALGESVAHVRMPPVLGRVYGLYAWPFGGLQVESAMALSAVENDAPLAVASCRLALQG
jgi:hypothetical protein